MSDDEATAILAAPDSYASVRPVEPQGVAITVTAQKTNWVPVAVVGSVVALGVLFAGIYLLRHPQSEWQQGPDAFAPVKLILFGCLGLALSPMVLIIHLVIGPPRNVELEAIPGTLKADRSIAGDRGVSTYRTTDVGCIFLEDNVLCIETRWSTSTDCVRPTRNQRSRRGSHRTPFLVSVGDRRRARVPARHGASALEDCFDSQGECQIAHRLHDRLCRRSPAAARGPQNGLPDFAALIGLPELAGTDIEASEPSAES